MVRVRCLSGDCSQLFSSGLALWLRNYLSYHKRCGAPVDRVLASKPNNLIGKISLHDLKWRGVDFQSIYTVHP
jgi:hypothetical protein